MGRELVPGLPIPAGYDQWYRRLRTDYQLPLGPQSLLQTYANSYVYLARPTLHGCCVTVRGGPAVESQRTRRGSARLLSPAVYSFESGKQATGVFTKPTKDTLLESSFAQQGDTALLTFRAPVDGRTYDLKIVWSLRRGSGGGDDVAERLVVWTTLIYCLKDYRLEMEEELVASALPPTIIERPEVVTMPEDPIWKDDHDAVDASQAVIAAVKLEMMDQERGEMRVVVNKNPEIKEDDKAMSLADKLLLYGSALRAASWADIQLVGSVEQLKVDYRHEIHCSCLGINPRKNMGLFTRGQREVSFELCWEHGHCPQCEMVNSCCNCRQWYEIHSCRHCDAILWRCECEERKRLMELYMPQL